ncbi:hypothetical protein M0Q03_03570 [bacterium]|jgi:hypothetical protein|nr:hypothetical protein [bacterium]
MFYSITGDQIIDVLNYVQGIFSDTLPFILLVSGLICGMYILGGLIINKEDK